MVGEWETVEMQLDSRVIILLKQKDFCGAIVLTYFVENCLDLPQQYLRTVFASHPISKDKSIYM